jgi:hypothetical protein
MNHAVPIYGKENASLSVTLLNTVPKQLKFQIKSDLEFTNLIHTQLFLNLRKNLYMKKKSWFQIHKRMPVFDTTTAISYSSDTSCVKNRNAFKGTLIRDVRPLFFIKQLLIGPRAS